MDVPPAFLSMWPTPMLVAGPEELSTVWWMTQPFTVNCLQSKATQTTVWCYYFPGALFSAGECGNGDLHLVWLLLRVNTILGCEGIQEARSEKERKAAMETLSEPVSKRPPCLRSPAESVLHYNKRNFRLYTDQTLGVNCSWECVVDLWRGRCLQLRALEGH